MSDLSKIGVAMPFSDCHYNARIKAFRGSEGELRPYEFMISDRPCFTGGGLESVDEPVTKAYEYGAEAPESVAARSRARAKRKLVDYVYCNNFDCFLTLTLDRTKINRDDYNSVVKRLGQYLGNRVRRRGMFYVGVPEVHQRGGYHFHFICNFDSLRVVDSGTVSVTGRKQPIKISTADKLGIPAEQRHTVYNAVDWELGFSTAIRTYGENKHQLVNYITKEFLKGVQQNTKNGYICKFGGRWYFSGGKLNKPEVRCFNVNFDDFEMADSEIDTAYGRFRVYYGASASGILGDI